ncbi:(2Fe-2S) ferredoxin domain-containing protein [Myxococcus sp. AM010]|uniref:(2Fe-2S) ferredoxin domain-containing protein n=1 Tax=Myxococcus sp. AM010 TaxID=2745138 RepID=UPI0015961A2C|nr:(2Fe-2S) ferredoxin domain-containing protein [Myxococcus sp. AM010]NVJ17417.1 (2Fe-2S) ferredoxin domain-containing protein [Myxococcus sp. AM010]
MSALEPPEPTELHVCHCCLMRLEVSAGGVDLPGRLQAALACRGLAERTRVMESGCLGECPEGLVSVMVLPDSGSGAHVQLIDPAKDGADLAEHVAALSGAKDGPP